MTPPFPSWIDDLLKVLISELIQQELISNEPTSEQRERARQLILDRANPIIKARKELKRYPFFLFVDVDGVLNHSKSIGWETTQDGIVLDKECLVNYFELVRFLSNLFRLKIILSSTWRLNPKAVGALKLAGVTWDDITPAKLTSTRSQEIRLSLKEQLNLSDEFNVLNLSNFIILDDEPIQEEWGDKLVKTDFQQGGFTEELLQETKEYILSIYPFIKQ